MACAFTQSPLSHCHFVRLHLFLLIFSLLRFLLLPALPQLTLLNVVFVTVVTMLPLCCVVPDVCHAREILSLGVQEVFWPVFACHPPRYVDLEDAQWCCRPLARFGCCRRRRRTPLTFLPSTITNITSAITDILLRLPILPSSSPLWGLADVIKIRRLRSRISLHPGPASRKRCLGF